MVKCNPRSSNGKQQQEGPLTDLGIAGLVGHFRLPLPLAFFSAVFPQRVFPWESLHKTLINTIFCVQLSQLEFPHTCALFPRLISARFGFFFKMPFP